MNNVLKGSIKGLLVVLILLFPAALAAQQQSAFTDYETFPELDYRFEHLDADLSIDHDSLSISGTVTYTVSARHRFAGELRLRATGLNILSVSLNDEEMGFLYENDEIIINPADSLENLNRSFEIGISYEAKQTQALLRTAAGTLFTTLAPNRRSEWIPIPEHPRVSFTTRMTVEINETKQLVSNGSYFRTINLEDGRKQVIWRSEVPLPSTDLMLLTGELQYAETLLGLTTIRLYGEARTGNQQFREELMREAINSISQLMRTLRVEYPYEGFTLVLLEDHLWEPRLSVASLGIVAGTISPLKTQIDRIAASQWFGSYLRPETVAGAGAHLLHQAALMEEMESDVPAFRVLGFPEVSRFPYWDHLLAQNFHYWLEGITGMDTFPALMLREQMREQLRTSDQVGSWSDFQRVWYRRFGRIIPEPDFEALRAVPDDAPPAAVQLVFGYSAERGISVTIDPQDRVSADSIRVPLDIYFRGGVLRQETLTVFRTGGEFVLPADSRPVNIIAGDGAPLFQFREMKDLTMWLHQLQNSPSVALRVQAAQNLSRFRDDPDIQLAVRDVLRAENHPEVRAALIRSISSIVRGAAGTQQLFLDMVSTAEGDELLAAVEALRNYPGNEAVVSATGRLVQSPRHSDAAVLAVRIFREVATEQQFTELASSLLGGSGPAAIRAAVVDELFELPDRMVAVDTSFEIVRMTSFPYLMRETALHALARHNRAPELRELVPLLIDDADPRMRLLALRYIGALDDALMNDLLEERFLAERDPRIRVVLEAF